MAGRGSRALMDTETDIRAFAEALMEGLDSVEAVRKARGDPELDPNACRQQAWRWRNTSVWKRIRPDVEEKIQEAVADLGRDRIMGAAERRAMLSAIARGEVKEEVIVDGLIIHKGVSLRDRTNAIKLLAAMEGDIKTPADTTTLITKQYVAMLPPPGPNDPLEWAKEVQAERIATGEIPANG